MRIVAALTLASGLSLAGGAAFAWSDIYTGDATNDPNSNFLMHAYDAPNMCPEGLQPVMAGGAICCGVPNAGAYVDRPGKAHRPRRTRPPMRRWAKRALFTADQRTPLAIPIRPRIRAA